MAEQAGIKITGLKKTLKSLQEIGVPTEAIKAANMEAAEKVLARARPLVPVRSGRLLSTLRVGKALNKVTVLAGSAKVPYANPIHWGWYRRHIAPKPFFADALGYSKEEIYQTYFLQLEKLVTEQSTRGIPTE